MSATSSARPGVRWLVAAVWLAAACGDDSSGVGARDAMVDADAAGDGGGAEVDAGGSPPDPAGCDPVVPGACLYPYPSMALLEPDPDTATGYRLSLPSERVAELFGQPVDGLLELFRGLDGAPASTPILAQLPGPLDPASLPAMDPEVESGGPSASVQLFDLTRGERVPVWAELDRRADSPADQALMIRPRSTLRPATRYAVVVTDALRQSDGEPVVPSDFYGAVRDGTGADLPAWRVAAFEELFERLAVLGIDREETLLAFQWVTASSAAASAPLREMALQAFERAADDAIFDYEVVDCQARDAADAAMTGCRHNPGLDPLLWRTLEGRFAVPGFVDAEGRIRFDALGRPEPAGDRMARFVASVPTSLSGASARSAPLVVFGHGYLTNPEDYLAPEVDDHGVLALSDELGAVFVGSEWSGFSGSDLGLLTRAIGEPTELPALRDALAQGVVDQLMVASFVHRALAQDPALAVPGAAEPLVEPDVSAYMGISLGAIAGTVLMALSQDLVTGVLHAPSSMWMQFVQHSDLFGPLQLLFDASFPSMLDQQLAYALMQRVVDPVEPALFATHLAEAPLTSLGPKNVLWQVNWGDSSAPDFNAYALARTAGVPLLSPAPHTPFGFTALQAPAGPGQSALAMFDPGLGRRPTDNDLGQQGTEAHHATRRNAEVRAQAAAFLQPDAPGSVIDPCGGPCFVEPEPRPRESTYP